MKGLTLIMSAVLITLQPKCEEEQTYRILSFFFDGVPSPSSREEIVEIQTQPLTTDDSTGQPALAVRKIKPEPELFLHKPYKEKKCDNCHKTGYGQKMTEASIDILCKSCHKNFVAKRQYTHGPVAVGQCLVCHNPHRSSYDNLLIRPGQELCTFCHGEINRENNPGHSLTESSTCVSCHSPHFSDVSVHYLRENVYGK